jgi:hypothetical protein
LLVKEGGKFPLLRVLVRVQGHRGHGLKVKFCKHILWHFRDLANFSCLPTPTLLFEEIVVKVEVVQASFFFGI